MAEGRLGYEKARLVARVADEDTVGAWIERARTTTALDLRRELEAGEERQMCARGEVELLLPRRVRVLVDAVVRAAREAERRWLKSGEALGVAAAHFLETWEPLVPRRRTRAQRVLDRDGGRCPLRAAPPPRRPHGLGPRDRRGPRPARLLDGRAACRGPRRRGGRAERAPA
jgi:hypothetical protein